MSVDISPACFRIHSATGYESAVFGRRSVGIVTSSSMSFFLEVILSFRLSLLPLNDSLDESMLL